MPGTYFSVGTMPSGCRRSSSQTMWAGTRIRISAMPSHSRMVFENKSPSSSMSGFASASCPLRRTMICNPALRIGCEKSYVASRAEVMEIAATPTSALPSLLDEVRDGKADVGVAYLQLQVLSDLVPKIDAEAAHRAVLVDHDRRQYTSHDPQFRRVGLGCRGRRHHQQRHQDKCNPTQHNCHKGSL